LGNKVSKQSKGEIKMAISWKVSEAIVEIQNGNKEAIQDIGKRFPLFANLAARVNSEAAIEIFKACPDYLTVRKVEDVLKEGVNSDSDSDSDVDNDNAEEKPKQEKVKNNTSADSADNEYQSKSSNELYKMLSARGLTKGRKFSKKADMIEALIADDEKKAGKAGNEDSDDEAVDYSEMTARELFELCKKRGIKAEPKQKAEVYIKLLDEFDAMNEPDDDDDDWGDSDDTKAEKPKDKKQSKKQTKKDDDDDDDWDI
jgi:hypothetical protein